AEWEGTWMELAAIVTIGVLFGAGVYLMLQGSLLRVVLGTALLSHGVNLLLLTSGKLKRGGPPILSQETASHGGDAVSHALQAVTVPLPQALILTAIVIGFGTTALILVIADRMYQEQGCDDLGGLRGLE